MTAIEDIAAERKRQIEQKGWSSSHDDAYENGQLANAAACYAHFAALSDTTREAMKLEGGSPRVMFMSRWWPRSREWWKPKDRRRDLVRAGALIVAEIERLDRLKAKEYENAD